MSNDGKVIWTPDGLKTLGARQPERIELRAQVGEWLRQFADVAEALGLGIHCRKCDGPLVGKNADSDKAFSQTCGCREFLWTNRDWRPPVDLPLH